MKDLVVFENAGWKVRSIEIDGEVLFLGKDVAEALGYKDTKDAVDRHCKGAVKRLPLQTSGGVQEVRVIAEPDLYRLIVKSNLPEAEKFEAWVFEVVLPQIRKTGKYEVKPMSMLEIMAESIARMQE